MPQMSSNHWMFYYTLVFFSLIFLSLNLTYFSYSYSSFFFFKNNYDSYYFNILI